MVLKIVVGSKNPTKIEAVQKVFSDYKVSSLKVPSLVSSQPFSDEETREGAINRAKACIEQIEKKAHGIGLEGGVMFIGKDLYLTSWGALFTKDETLYTASGARIKLPKFISNELLPGKELKEAMESYTTKKHIHANEGAVGIFTNNFISRTALFIHIVKLLRGQFEYWQ